MGNMNPREIALKILYRLDVDQTYLNIALDNSLKNSYIKQLDRALTTELVYGVVRWKLTLDYIIGLFSKVKIRKISPWIINILRLGIYQIMFMDKVPVSAACNESVELARKYGHKATTGYVNGVLRNVARNKDSIQYPDINQDKVKYLSVKYSFPEWMVSMWLERYGYDFALELMDHSNKIPFVTVRVNTLKASRDSLKSLFVEAGIACRNGEYVNSAIVLDGTGSIAEMDTFKQGYFQVQDESSMLVAQILDPKQNEMVVDVCAAPGGKATHIAELMGNKGLVIARDIHKHKINLIEQSARRLGIDIIRAEVHDALNIDERLIGKADRVIVDAPCTGFGIIRRKPDIKWLRTEEQAREIVALQQKMLDISSMYLKTGGTLVYSTCTIEPAENVEIFESFLARHSEFMPVDFTELLPPKLQKQTAVNGHIQLYPNTDKIDGFFIAKARRVR